MRAAFDRLVVEEMKKTSILGMAALLAAAQLFTGCGKKGPAEEVEGDSAAQGQVASEEEMAEPLEVLEEGMTPVSGDQLKDGTYEVKVDSSSKMFRITHCSLTVENGNMTAVMTMGGTGYLKLFMGTGEEAIASPESDYIPFVENEEGLRISDLHWCHIY